MSDSEDVFIGRTFDDFLFRPQHSPVSSRREIDLAMPLVAGIGLGLPVVGANMDSVVGEEMAKTLALEGALGYLHRNCPIDVQAGRVRYVKSRHSYVIEHPIVLPRTTKMRDVKTTIERLRASGILLEEEPGTRVLAGILSHRDMPSGPGHDERPASDFMTPYDRLVTRPPTVTTDEAERVMYARRVEKLPLVDGDGQIRGLITMRDLKLYKQKPYSVKDERGRLRVGAAIGATGDFLDRAEALLGAEVDTLLLDIAHADSEVAGRALAALKGRFPDVAFVVGNVATGDAARWLIERGAAAIKVGVGPGRGCRTRLETGAGVPQLQAIREVYLATEGRVPIIADGGVSQDKDVFLAIACGASTVMLGSILAGTDEAPGVIIEDPATRQRVKIYRGMTSPEAVADASSPEGRAEALSTPAEGQSVRVPHVGSVVSILARLRGHLRSAVSYAGEDTLDAARRKIASDPSRYLIPLSEAARRESFIR